MDKITKTINGEMDQQDLIDHKVIEDELIEKLPHFESFFNRVGFKRIDGAIFGLLCFSKKPLTSEQIETKLGLSQSAVSQSLKTLAQYSMIESRDHRELKRLKLHYAKDDALKVVSSVIRKRELEYLREFEVMASEALKIVDDEPRKKRLSTILATSTFARTLCEVIVNVSDELKNPYPVIEKLPQFASFMQAGIPKVEVATEQIKNQIKNTFQNKLNGWLDASGEKR
ncbi:GbsR/MarR family transcriptional regulator [Bacteriovorax sp. DB6_IX]|uniref:GbsR/MarR family transcriptional regulator n=1 Tax=Bacteriovorax sp. DB6_IX TaxID=1353530 RepID=UPI00038A39AF|nr:ArsR family transcriptional regulator [Bacteriovorax sp. DB6_IX]EQC52260.1 transcriptional regulator, ArsR family [Bacteriovorax sp. DB6_IX]